MGGAAEISVAESAVVPATALISTAATTAATTGASTAIATSRVRFMLISLARDAASVARAAAESPEGVAPVGIGRVA
jgi:hypothetical protein